LPLSCADHAGALFKTVSPDIEIEKKHGCATTKTAAILREMGYREK
jgi:hypothetical protein